MIGEYLLENYDAYDLNGDGTSLYILFKGEQGNAEAEYRTQYAVEDANALLTEALASRSLSSTIRTTPTSTWSTATAPGPPQPRRNT